MEIISFSGLINKVWVGGVSTDGSEDRDRARSLDLTQLLPIYMFFKLFDSHVK